MKALIHNQSMGTLKLDESAPLPTTNNGEHLIKVDAAAITTGELLWPRPAELNESVPGVEAAGTVVTALSTSQFKPGDQVYFRTQYPRAGSAREYSIGLESEMAIRPSNVSAEEAAAVPVSALTAWQALLTKIDLNSLLDGQNGSQPNRRLRVFINGASGGVGLFLTQLAHLAGCQVVGTSTNEKLVREMGADEVINYKSTSITEWRKSHDARFDLILDLVGGHSLDEAWHLADEHGTVLTFVPPADMQWKFDLDRPAGISETVSGKFFLMQTNGKHLQQITRLIEDGRLRPTVDSVHRMDDYRQAFDRAFSGRAVGKVVLQVRAGVS
ncbi:hypothetical protein PMZ80_009861 [Knufia obscura]|uniref:Enoyl reductase (ER) domain-containing protein n=2 Tax=Knufia TaxID=430999 RepID=A0AAN8I7I5_9EURO|nr:hypothetical protein PMZ80_009861 [Knufia obscura]KAK5955954.1 hypothetical protein OHC33_002527 [Knufia fluminis]